MDVKSDMNPPLHPARSLKWLLILLGLVGIGAAAFFGIRITSGVSDNRRIDRERILVKDRLAAVRLERVLRPVLFEPEEQGNSWDLILRALEGLKALTQADLEAFPRLNPEEEGELKIDEAEKALLKLAPSLEALRGALRRRWTEPSHAYEKHFTLEVPAAKPIQLARVLCDASVLRHESGRTAEAIDFLTLAWGLGDRIAVKGSILSRTVAIIITGITNETLQEQLANHRYSGSDLARLQRTVDTLVKSHADLMASFRIDDLLGRILAINYATLEGEVFKDLPTPDSPLAGLSRRSMAVRYLDVQDQLMAGLEQAMNLPYSDQQEALGRIRKEALARESQLHAIVVPQMGRLWRNYRHEVEELSLARLALATARHVEDHGAWPESLDALAPSYLESIPTGAFFGEPFTYVTKGDTATIYSRGEDGDDDGGRPFDDKVGGDPDDCDLVWTMKRRK